MRWISTRVHGVIDYAFGILLIVAPSLFGMPRGTPYSWFPLTLGIVLLVYSVLTRYEWGVVRRIPAGVHHVLDGLIGIAFIAAPWVLDMPAQNIVPLTFIGIVVIAIAAMSETELGTEDEFTAIHLGGASELESGIPTSAPHLDAPLGPQRDERDRERRIG